MQTELNNSKIKRNLHKIFYKLKSLLRNTKFSPVFIIGCGRSGTTILGETLGRGPGIVYLNERRDLWHKAYPEFDIWSGIYKNPKLVAGLENIEIEKSSTLISLFKNEQFSKKGNILLEKLPINNFRLQFLNEVFPDAKFIYLHRNGIEVASSIERYIRNGGNWYGHKNKKWEQLILQTELTSYSDKKLTDFEKGLLEWNISMTYSEKFFNSIEKSRFYSLSYQSLLDSPKFHLEKIFEFLGVNLFEESLIPLSNSIKRKHPEVYSLSEKDLKMGGEFLQSSVNNELRR